MFEEIISLENLLLAWQEFVSGKRDKVDVQEFERELMDNILYLHDELANGAYRHGPYHSFHICDPKPRHIHKATVRDRLLHHAIHRVLYPIFDHLFISDSFSCRVDKGIHAAGARFRSFINKTSENNTRTCWVLKCDIRKFFASIDHVRLSAILARTISDALVMRLLQEVISSFHASPGRGLPLGNLTSQLLANIYMNELDCFMKNRMGLPHYIRYADDFVILHPNRVFLVSLVPCVSDFLQCYLLLHLHPRKIALKTLASGVDFLGWSYFPTHKVLRTVTKRRAFRNIVKRPVQTTLQSYLGLLGHGNAYKIEQELRNVAWLYST
ncbi:MAG: reverse transcriptase domain-containing protein [Patescibacteria group bacterium]